MLSECADGSLRTKLRSANDGVLPSRAASMSEAWCAASGANSMSAYRPMMNSLPLSTYPAKPTHPQHTSRRICFWNNEKLKQQHSCALLCTLPSPADPQSGGCVVARTSDLVWPLPLIARGVKDPLQRHSMHATRDRVGWAPAGHPDVPDASIRQRAA